MLCAQGVSVSRGHRPVLQNIDLEVRRGEIIGVLGPNGAGKSTLLAALAGELLPARGSVSLNGRPLTDWHGPERARTLAVLPQSSTLGFAFRVEEVVGMGRLPHATGQRVDELVIAEALAAVDGLHLKERSYLALSGGERQRVHLARVLAQLWPAREGQVLLLDEPTSMLDPLHQHGVLQAVRTLADQGVAVLVIVHDLNLAACYCDRILLLQQGHSFRLGPTVEVLQPEPLERLFGLEVLVQPHPERDCPLIIVR